jgi:hypothetical protein
MESLLRWGIEHSAPPDPNAAPTEPKNFDPEIIDHILGKSDAVRMKEAMAAANDLQNPLKARLTALEDLEMLVQSIDNANDLEPLKLWEPLIVLMSSDVDKIRFNALWILGTAVQNNPRAQNVFLSHDPLPALLSMMSKSSDSSAETRSKAIYCLSGTLKHNRAAVLKLDDLGGWEALREGLSDPNISVRRKIAFLLNTLLLQDLEPPPAALATSNPAPTKTALQDHKIISRLIELLESPLQFGEDGDEAYDLDFAEKAGEVLVTYSRQGGAFNDEDKPKLRIAIQEGKNRNEEWVREVGGESS